MTGLLRTGRELSRRLSRYKSVMHKGSLVAAVIALLATGLAPGLVASQLGPSIQVAPTPVGRGQQVYVHGSGFCGSTGCSTVTIMLDDTVLGSEVHVEDDGTFTFSFIALQVPNQYGVAARQTSADGSILEATYGLLILPAELPPGQTPAPVDTAAPSPTAIQETTDATPAPPSGTPGTSTPILGSATTSSATGAQDGGGGSAIPWVLIGAIGIAGLTVLVVLAWRRLRGNR